MVKLAEVYKRLAPSQNLNKLAVYNQSTNDIINQVLSQHAQNAIEAKKIADLFEAGNIYETSKNIWNFLKYEVPYKVEPSDRQTTKTLSRMLYDASNGKGNDCKHYAGFTGAVLDACGYTNWSYRFAGYSKYINVPTHVYCYAKDSDGIIYIDAVINGFDLEKPFVLNIDKKIKIKDNNMSLYKLSGIEDNGIGNWFEDAGKAVKQAADFAGDKARQAADYAKKEAERVAKQVADGIKTIGLAIPRNAFLVLLRFNVHGWATGLKNRDWNQLSWWSNDFGGNRTDLVSAINDGAKKASILGFDYNDTIYPSMIGGIGEPVTIATSLASAAPIIVKVSNLLDSAQKVAQKVEDIKTKITPIIETANKASAGFEAITGKKISDVIFKKQAGATGDKNGLTASDVITTTKEDATKVANAIVNNSAKKESATGFNLDTKTMLLIGGAGIALLLILKKK
jgi:hypothetical protein